MTGVLSPALSKRPERGLAVMKSSGCRTASAVWGKIERISSRTLPLMSAEGRGTCFHPVPRLEVSDVQGDVAMRAAAAPGGRSLKGQEVVRVRISSVSRAARFRAISRMGRKPRPRFAQISTLGLTDGFAASACPG